MRTETYYNEMDVPYDSSKKILVQIFTSETDIEHTVKPMISEIKSRLTHAAIIGASSRNVIGHGKLGQKSVITVTYMEHSYAHTALIPYNEKFEKSLKTNINALKRRRKESKAAIVFGSKYINGDKIVEFSKEDNVRLPIVGGLCEESGVDSEGNEVYFVFTEDGIIKDGVAICFLYGSKLKIMTEIDSRWMPIGHKFKVTKAQGNKVYELDNTPIKEVYKKYLGDEVVSTIEKDTVFALNYPLLLESKNDEDLVIARAIVLQNDEFFTFAGDIKEGEIVSFGFDDIGNNGSIGSFCDKEKFIENVESIFLYSCTARKMVSWSNTEDEYTYFNKIAPTNGFFTYGEFYFKSDYEKFEIPNKEPLCNNKFLNQTLVILGMCEKEARSKNRNIDEFCTPLANENAINIKRRALNHFIKTVTEELQNTIDEKNRLLTEAKELQAATQYQLGKGLVEKMMQILHERVLNNIQLINSSVAEISFKNDIDTVSPKELAIMKANVDVAVENINSILIAFKKLTTMDGEVMSFYAKDVLQTIHTVYSYTLSKYNISLIPVLTPEQNNYTLSTRKYSLEQILLPIINNAVEAIINKGAPAYRGEILLGLEKLEDGLAFTVTDNGVGFDDDFELIFKHNFTTKNSKTKGAGLGMYLNKMIAKEQINADIQILRNKGDGLTVKLLVPNLPLEDKKESS